MLISSRLEGPILQAITKRLRCNKRGLSSVIVVMLSLVLIVIIVGNVILWSYQMNQLDMERMQENLKIENVTRITRSSWFTAQKEFALVAGNKLAGTYTDTAVFDGHYETFTEASDTYRLCIANNFTIESSVYPLNCVGGIEIFVRYNVTEDLEKWFVRAYDWTNSSFSDAGFNSTEGNQPVRNEWNEYGVSVAENWTNYVKDDGSTLIEFLDEGISANQTTVHVDFVGVRAIIDGACIDLKNSSPLTVHVVAIWIVNSTNHRRYEADLFMNSGEEATYILADVSLPRNDYMTKIVTERGNLAVFTGS